MKPSLLSLATIIVTQAAPDVQTIPTVNLAASMMKL